MVVCFGVVSVLVELDFVECDVMYCFLMSICGESVEVGCLVVFVCVLD